MHLKKTGELIRSSIVAGAILGEAKESDIEKLDIAPATIELLISSPVFFKMCIRDSVRGKRNKCFLS